MQSSNNLDPGHDVDIFNGRMIQGYLNGGSYRGVRILTGSGASWTEVLGDVSSHGPYTGANVAINEDYALSAYDDNIDVYERSGASWSSSQTLSNFTSSRIDDIDMTNEKAIVQTSSGSEPPVVLTRSGSTWSQLWSPSNILTNNDNGVAISGNKVAISTNNQIFIYDLNGTAPADTITDTGANGTLGAYLPSGATFTISGTGSNDGAYLVASVTDSDTIVMMDLIGSVRPSQILTHWLAFLVLMMRWRSLMAPTGSVRRHQLAVRMI